MYLTQRKTENGYNSLSKTISWPALGTSLVIFFLLSISNELFYKPYRQQVTMAHIIENVTVMERSESYAELFPLTPHGRTSMMIYLMNKMTTAVPDALSTLDSSEKAMVLKDIHNLRGEVENYIGTTPTHYRLVLSLVRLLHLEHALQTDIEKREGILSISEG